jgi:hypothetical protein
MKNQSISVRKVPALELPRSFPRDSSGVEGQTRLTRLTVPVQVSPSQSDPVQPNPAMPPSPVKKTVKKRPALRSAFDEGGSSFWLFLTTVIAFRFPRTNMRWNWARSPFSLSLLITQFAGKEYRR